MELTRPFSKRSSRKLPQNLHLRFSFPGPPSGLCKSAPVCPGGAEDPSDDGRRGHLVRVVLFRVQELQYERLANSGPHPGHRTELRVPLGSANPWESSGVLSESQPGAAQCHDRFSSLPRNVGDHDLFSLHHSHHLPWRLTTELRGPGDLSCGHVSPVPGPALTCGRSRALPGAKIRKSGGYVRGSALLPEARERVSHP